jgi:hypothetical protein
LDVSASSRVTRPVKPLAFSALARSHSGTRESLTIVSPLKVTSYRYQSALWLPLFPGSLSLQIGNERVAVPEHSHVRWFCHTFLVLWCEKGGGGPFRASPDPPPKRQLVHGSGLSRRYSVDCWVQFREASPQIIPNGFRNLFVGTIVGVSALSDGGDCGAGVEEFVHAADPPALGSLRCGPLFRSHHILSHSTMRRHSLLVSDSMTCSMFR